MPGKSRAATPTRSHAADRTPVRNGEGSYARPIQPDRCTVAYRGIVIIPWDPAGAGVVGLPSGRLVRGRSLRRPPPPGPAPTLTVYLLGQPPPAGRGQARWLRWSDFWLPADPAQARKVLVEAWESALSERVEIACRGGRGRTGTALACLAVIDGIPPRQAVAFVRRQYHPHAVETPWQKRYVRRFPALRRQQLIVHATRCW
jgi:hypothetical protein